MKHSFLIQVDTDDMEYHAQFDAQKLAEVMLNACVKEAKRQHNSVADAEVNYLGSN